MIKGFDLVFLAFNALHSGRDFLRRSAREESSVCNGLHSGRDFLQRSACEKSSAYNALHSGRDFFAKECM